MAAAAREGEGDASARTRGESNDASGRDSRRNVRRAGESAARGLLAALSAFSASLAGVCETLCARRAAAARALAGVCQKPHGFSALPRALYRPALRAARAQLDRQRPSAHTQRVVRAA